MGEKKVEVGGWGRQGKDTVILSLLTPRNSCSQARMGMAGTFTGFSQRDKGLPRGQRSIPLSRGVQLSVPQRPNLLDKGEAHSVAMVSPKPSGPRVHAGVLCLPTVGL